MEVEPQQDSRSSVLAARVNGSQLARNVGGLVALVGRVTGMAPDGGCVQVTAADGGAAVVRLADPSAIMQDHVYEFTGRVMDDNSVQCMTHVQYSDNFDLATYNKMVTLAHDPRFASSMFFG